LGNVLPQLSRGLVVVCLLSGVPSGLAAASAPAAPAQASAGITAAEAVSVTAAKAAAANARIRSVLPKRTQSKALGQHFTMTVWDPATSSYIFRKRSTAQLRGASTTKVLTSVAGLHVLGARHRMPTRVKAGAKATEVVLVGGGDPLLTSANLRSLAKVTAAKLATTAEAGQAITVRADDSLFEGSGISRGWATRWVPSQVRPVGPFARDDRQVRYPTTDAGSYFASSLRAFGVKATYRGEGTAAPNARNLAVFAGHTVGQAVAHALLVSDNDTAEMLFRHVALGTGQPSTWAGARTAMAATLKELGIPLAKVRIVDGSGLSMDARLTAGALTAALRAAISPRNPELAPLRSWLPVAGRTGTLRASDLRFTAKPARCAAGRIRAKTGTLADAIALAGYATGADGRSKVFVAVVNDRPTKYTRTQTRRAVDNVAASLTGCW
jgi:D-alanyl-D-alanine carboxypeptidase/D-alanyl-D-alanine-endopeptidase (penicillin-binding protein 4)